MKQADSTSSKKLDTHRDTVRQIMLDVLDQDNSLSQCCAVQALTKLGAADDATQQRLITLLRDPDADVRMQTAHTLGELKSASAIEALVYNLENDPEGDVRIQAVIALAKITSDQTLAPLVRCLEQDGYPQLDHSTDDMEFSACWEVQSQALNALGKLGDVRGVAPIIKLLENDEYEHLQEQGFRVLAQIDSTQTLAFLLKQLKQGSHLARRRAAQALSSAAVFNTDDKELSVEVLTALSHALGDSDPSVRLYVARALAQTHNPLVSAPLILLLNDPDAEVRHEVAKLLGKMRSSDVVDRLHTLLSEADCKHKASIVHVLGDIADPTSVEILTALLDTNDSDLLYEVVWALGECGLPDPEIQLATILANEKNDPALRIQAAQSLAKLLNNKTSTELKLVQENISDENTSDNDSIEKQDAPTQCSPRDVLTKTIYDKHAGVSYAALDALVKIDPETAQQMLTDLLLTTPATATMEQDIQSDDSVTAMTLEEATEQQPELVRQFNLDASPENSTLAAMLATSSDAQDEADEIPDSKQPTPGQQTDSEAMHLKTSPHEPVRILAARLLGNKKGPGNDEYSTETITALIHCAQHESTALRVEALLTLGRIKTQLALPVIQQALKSEQRNIKLAALEALGQLLDNTEATALKDIEFAHLHTDPDADIRRSAMQVMLAIDLPQTRERVYQALQDEHIEVCRTALNALTHSNHHPEYTDGITNLMFTFSGDLRIEAATTLRRVSDFGPAPRLLKMLVDPKQEEYHWICIDALAEMYAVKPDHHNNPGASYAA